MSVVKIFAVVPEQQPMAYELETEYKPGLMYVPRSEQLDTQNEDLQEQAIPVDRLSSSVAAVSTKKIKVSPPTKSANQVLRFLKPVQNAIISSVFGKRWGKMHKGIDIAAKAGTPVIAAESGKVVYSGWQNGYGNFVAIDHGAGYVSRYAHSSKLLVRSGQIVTQGQRIALVGNTGKSTGPHLHFELTNNGVPRNPSQLINKTVILPSTVQ